MCGELRSPGRWCRGHLRSNFSSSEPECRAASASPRLGASATASTLQSAKRRSEPASKGTSCCGGGTAGPPAGRCRVPSRQHPRSSLSREAEREHVGTSRRRRRVPSLEVLGSSAEAAQADAGPCWPAQRMPLCVSAASCFAPALLLVSHVLELQEQEGSARLQLAFPTAILCMRRKRPRLPAGEACSTSRPGSWTPWTIASDACST